MTRHDDPFMAAVARLRAEGQQLEDMLEGLPHDSWHRETPAAGWTIAHQIAHLAWTDQLTIFALQGASAFRPYAEAAAEDSVTFVNNAAEEGARRSPQELFSDWAEGRRNLAEALGSADRNIRYPWFGPPMKARSLITARIMETWAHGQDVAHTLETKWEPSDALKDIAHLGYSTRTFTYAINGLSEPTSDMYVQLTGPSGDIWTWGDSEAQNQIVGTAWDFALLVTQRAEIGQLQLSIRGKDAEIWATIAQAFAGPPKSIVRARNTNLGTDKN